jgi:magnesium transporter
MMLLSKEQADRVTAILSEREATAQGMMAQDFLTMSKETLIGDALTKIRCCGLEPENISYIYIVGDNGKTMLGVVDIRELLLHDDNVPIGEIMISPVVTAEENDVQEDLAEIFAKYHYRMIPVVDEQDNMLGVIRYNDIMKGVETRIKI